MRRNVPSIDQVLYTWRHHGRRAALGVVRDRARRRVGRLLLAYQYPNVQWGRNVQVQGKLIIRGQGTVVIGNHVTLAGHNQPLTLVATTPGSRIEIGADCGLSGTVIIAAGTISIGRGCAVGRARISDNDWHAVDGQRRGAGSLIDPRPVTIGDNVWLGDATIVTAGVTIGSDAVVGAGSVIRNDVAPGTVVVGNPQRDVRRVQTARSLDTARVIELIEEATQSIPGTVDESTRIDTPDLWDSQSVVLFLSLVEDETGHELTLADLAGCATPPELAATISRLTR